MTKIPNVHGQFEFRLNGYERSDGMLRCSYCGSITLAAFLQGVKSGARPELADRKYGHLHKIYLRDVPSQGHWRTFTSSDEVTKKSETGEALEKTRTEKMVFRRTSDVKFYTEHVKDGSEEDQKAYWTWLNAYIAPRLGPAPTDTSAPV